MNDDRLGMMSRRRFLAASGAACVGLALGDFPALQAAVAARRAKTVSIFHTTDLHGHIVPTANYDGVGDVGGLARCVTQIRRWKKEFPDSLLLDIGDVYQGTPESYNNGGKLMIELFNKLGYDAWALGNHDFDWGRANLEAALAASKSGIISGNIRIDGKLPGEAAGVWDKVRPWTVKEVGGFRIGLVGIITPGLPYWLTPSTLGGVEVLNPIESLRRSIDEIRAEKPDAIVVMGHLGWRFQGDDFANPVKEMLQQVAGVDVLLAGHTHQDQPSWMSGKVLCTQASYYGIHCGRVDLTFDLESRKLLERRAFTVLMDSRFDMDPLVIEIAKPELAKAEEQMKKKVCTFLNEVPAAAVPALICEALAAGLYKANTPVDGVFHGMFGKQPIPAGDKTVADCWDILPYENGMLVAELGVPELTTIVAEDKGKRTLWPFEVDLTAAGETKKFLFKGQPVEPGKRFRIGFNTYDGQSGGQDLMQLSEILSRPESKRQETQISTRQALIDYFLEKGKI